MQTRGEVYALAGGRYNCPTRTMPGRPARNLKLTHYLIVLMTVASSTTSGVGPGAYALLQPRLGISPAPSLIVISWFAGTRLKVSWRPLGQ
jgi:hypothetical protein